MSPRPRVPASPRPRVPASPRPVWLLALSALAILTHPSLDWLNTYGMRWLMPFDGRWSYGDSVYIMDPWLWLTLGCGLLLGKRPTPLLIGTFLLITFAIARVVFGRSPGYLLLVGLMALVLFLALLWRPPAFSSRLPAVALLISITYVAARIALNEATEARVVKQLGPVQSIMAAPHPLDPTRWDVVAQLSNVYRFGRYNWRARSLTLDPREIPLPRNSPEYAAARRDPSARGFVTWVRFPWYEVERTATETRVHIRDARRLRLRQSLSSGGVTVVLPGQSRRRTAIP